MYDPMNVREPAPELSPDEYLTVLEFGIHEPEYQAVES